MTEKIKNPENILAPENIPYLIEQMRKECYEKGYADALAEAKQNIPTANIDGTKVFLLADVIGAEQAVPTIKTTAIPLTEAQRKSLCVTNDVHIPGAYQPPVSEPAEQQGEQEPVARFNWNAGKFEWLTEYDFYKHNMKPLYLAAGAAPDVRRETLEEAAKLCENIYEWRGATSAGILYISNLKACAAAIRSLK